MKKSAVLDLKKILVTLRKEIGRPAHTELCANILHCWLESGIVGLGDAEAFANWMLDRFENGRYPFNLK